MTNLSIGGDTFRVEVEGDATKPAVLLAHALGSDLTLWDAQMPALLKAFRVIRYDSRGHGGSTADGGAYSIATLGRDALGILDALEIETAHFVGISMGGAVGQWLLANAPRRVERAVLANTTAKFGKPTTWNERIVDVLRDGMAAVVDGTMDRWFSPNLVSDAPEPVAAVRRVFETTSPLGYAACCAALRDLDLRAATYRVTAPVLVVSGRDDQSIGEEATRYLVETIPDAKHVALDARHISNVEAEAAFSKAVVGFLTARIPTKAKRPIASGGLGTPVRPTTTVNRRVGTRRSTAARLPLAGLPKVPAAKAPTPKTQVTAKGVKSIAPPATKPKTKTAKIERPELEPKSAKAASAKVARAKAPHAKTTTTKTTPTKTAATAKQQKRLAKGTSPAKPVAAKRGIVTTKGKAAFSKIAPTKIAKRPSAKSLKAMAAGPAAKARTSPTKVASPKATGATKGKTATRLVSKSRATQAKSAPTKRETAKSAVKTPSTKAAAVAGKAAKAKATPMTATKTKIASKAVSKAKAKPGRRAS